jgi:hypothetical protein
MPLVADEKEPPYRRHIICCGAPPSSDDCERSNMKNTKQNEQTETRPSVRAIINKLL